MYSHKRKSSRDSNVLQESHSEREIKNEIERKTILAEHREISEFLELRAGHAAQREKAAPSIRSEAEHQTRLLLEEQKNHFLSEARSDWNMQELNGFSVNAWISTRR